MSHIVASRMFIKLQEHMSCVFPQTCSSYGDHRERHSRLSNPPIVQELES